MRDRRVLAFVVLAIACTAGVAAAIASAVVGARDDGEARGTLTRMQASGEPVVLFRIPRAEGPGRGQVAVARVADPSAPETTPLRCDRVHYAADGGGVCVARGGGFAAGYSARLFGADLRVRDAVELEGVPSRARVSPDGRYGTVTMFVSGHSYAEAGTFSTQTTLLDMEAGTALADLEDFTVTVGDRQVTAADQNYWGVTFGREDSDRFYATLATGGETFLIEGSVRGRTARAIHENVECPSLSPDGTRIAYKRRTGSATVPWRLTVLDLATMRETALAETDSLDDQAEWLDDDTVLYGMGDEVRAVPADGSGRPERYLANAASPAVVR